MPTDLVLVRRHFLCSERKGMVSSPLSLLIMVQSLQVLAQRYLISVQGSLQLLPHWGSGFQCLVIVVDKWQCQLAIQNPARRFLYRWTHANIFKNGGRYLSSLLSKVGSFLPDIPIFLTFSISQLQIYWVNCLG